MNTKLIFILFILSLLNACATKIPITKVPSEEAIAFDGETHHIKFERLSNSIKVGSFVESIQSGFACEIGLGSAWGLDKRYSDGPGKPLYMSKAELKALGVERPDLNLLAIKTIEDVLKNNNINISSKTDLRLSALITDVKMNTCWFPYSQTKNKGEHYLKIKWTLYSKALTENIFEGEYESYSEEVEFKEKNMEKLLMDTYAKNVNKLINDKNFRKVIDKENQYASDINNVLEVEKDFETKDTI